MEDWQRNNNVFLFSYSIFIVDIDVGSFIKQAPYCVHMVV